jgi:DUF1365 family protein
MMRSALYTGTVRHRRLAPRHHAFTYPVFMAFLDLDQLPALCAVSRLLGFNRFAWASYDDRDHVGDPALPLRARLQASAEAAGHRFPAGKVFLLANLRFWGYCFNPVSYVYAYAPDGSLALLGAEVMNTPWRERVLYWLEPGAGASSKGFLAFDVAKAMHVSPFMPMELHYRWTFSTPDEALRVRMALHQGPDLVFDVDLDLTARAWTPQAIRRTLLAFPFHTLKVITAIHWEALKLWLKRVPIHTHPAKAIEVAGSPPSPVA